MQCSGSLIPSSNIPAHSRLVVSSSGRAVLIFHWDVGASLICFLCFYDVSAALTASPPPPVTHLQEAARRRKAPSLHRSCHSHLWQTASCRRMFSLFPWSQHGCSHENAPECFMSPCRQQKIMTRHKRLAHRGISQKKEPRDEWWRLTERERKMWIFSHLTLFGCFVIRRLFTVV